MAVVALFQPGAMGSRLGGELVSAGHDVRWLAPGRSTATAERAAVEGLQSIDDVHALLGQAEVCLSVLPPQAAVDIAHLAAGAGFTGTYVDANPLSPPTLADVQATVEKAGAGFVDAGVVGPPPRDGRRTHLYLAGAAARVAGVEALFRGTRVRALVVGDTVGQASAAKQSYALFNKGRMVLASLAGRLAEAHGVAQVLAGEGDRPGADLLTELADLHEGLAEVGWRWGPELEELAVALEEIGTDPSAVRGLAAELARRTG